MDDDVRSFLLAEMALLNDTRTNWLEIYTSQLNAFFTLVTASLGGTLVFAASGIPSIEKSVTVGAILGSLLSVSSVLIFLRAIDIQISTRVAIRGLNRIRHLFTEGHEEIHPFLVLPRDGTFPPIDHLGYTRGFWRSLTGEAASLSATIIASTLTAWAWIGFFEADTQLDSQILACAFTFSLSLGLSGGLLRRTARLEFQRAERHENEGSGYTPPANSTTGNSNTKLTGQ